MKILGYFVFLQLGLFAAYAYSFKTLQTYKEYPWVSDDDTRDSYINQMRVYTWTFGLSSAVMLAMFTWWLGTEFLTQYQKFVVLKWAFSPVAVGFMVTYVVIFDCPKIYRLLNDKETRSTAMQHSIMRTPTPMRVFWVGSGIALATAGLALLTILEFVH